MKRFYLLFLGLLLLGFSTAFSQNSEPTSCIADNLPTTVRQPDNSILTIVGKGNMSRSWTETTDGYTIILNSNGFYEYAEKINGELLPSGIRVHEVGQRSVQEMAAASRMQKSLEPQPIALKETILNQVAGLMQNKSMPTTGNIRVLALLIDFPDLQATYSVNDFDSLLNGSSFKNAESFSSFFYKSSDGLLNIQVDIKGWYRASKNYIHYGKDSGSVKAAGLVREAIDAAELDNVDFSVYDNDSNGYVDGIMAIHAGPGAEQGSRTQYIWSHRWSLMYAGKSVTYDGKGINDYIINPEVRTSWAGNRQVGIGVFCHEFGHNLGLPDLYDTDDNNGRSEGIGNWGLMAGAGWLGSENFPGDLSAWSKIELSWKTPILIDQNSPGSYTLHSFGPAQKEIFKMNIPGVPDEYFLLENRQKTALDTMLPGHGLAVFRINTQKTTFSGNGVNADENNKGVGLLEADGSNDLDNSRNRGDAGDLFPGSTQKFTLGNVTNPHTKSQYLFASGVEITNIRENNKIISFDIGMHMAAGCSGLTTLTNASGSLSDGSGLANYVNNMNCSWLIQPIGASSINLSFTSFDTEQIHDSVSVYDGSSASAPLIGSFSGNSIPQTIVSTGNSLFVTFKTNSMTTAAGWEASYTSNSGVFLSALIDTVTIGAAYLSSATIPVSSNVTWAATDNVAWAAPTTSFGSGSANISLVATQPNIGPKRYGMFYIEDASNNLIDSVVIEQLGSGKYLLASPNIMLFPVKPLSNDTIFLQANVNWTLTNTSPWLNVSQISGNTDAEIVVDASNNTGNLSRYGSIEIKGPASVSPHTMVVFQAGPLYVSPKNINVGVASNTFKASSDNQTPIKATSPQAWLATSKTIITGTAGDPDTSLFTVNAAPNNTGSIRSGMIIVNDSWSKDTVFITQNPSSNYLETTPDTLRFTDSGGLLNFNILSDTLWQISTSMGFSSINKTSGKSNDQVEVNVPAYSGLAERMETIAVNAVNDPQIKDSVVIVQAAPVVFQVAPNSIFLASALGSMDSVSITSNVNWTVTHKASWLSLSGNSGSGNSKLYITAASENQSGMDRKDTLTFSSPSHSDVLVEVTQFDLNTPTFSVSTDTVYLQDYQGSQGKFTVLGNQNWNIVENTPWLILNPLSGSGIADINLLAASKNVNGNSREAKVIVSSSGFKDIDVTVIQLGSTPQLSVSRDSIRMKADTGDVQIFYISSNLNSWSLSHQANWFSVSPVAGGFTQKIEVTSKDSNASGSIRMDTITLSAAPHVPVHIKVFQDTGLNVGLKTYNFANSISVYPNPVRELLTVDFHASTDISAIEVDLYDAVGKKVAAKAVHSRNQVRLDVSQLEGGFYFLHLSDGKSRATRVISVVGKF